MNKPERTRLHALTGFVALLATGKAMGYGVTCAIDQASAYFTGTTQIDSQTGKLLQLWRCARGHSFWIVA